MQWGGGSHGAGWALTPTFFQAHEQEEEQEHRQAELQDLSNQQLREPQKPPAQGESTSAAYSRGGAELGGAGERGIWERTGGWRGCGGSPKKPELAARCLLGATGVGMLYRASYLSCSLRDPGAPGPAPSPGAHCSPAARRAHRRGGAAHRAGI